LTIVIVLIHNKQKPQLRGYSIQTLGKPANRYRNGVETFIAISTTLYPAESRGGKVDFINQATNPMCYGGLTKL
jgi:hypothetical protein